MTPEREDAAVHKAWCNSLWARVPTYNWILECDCGATEHKPAAPEPAPELAWNWETVAWKIATEAGVPNQAQLKGSIARHFGEALRKAAAQQHSQPCPVTVEELREIATYLDRMSAQSHAWKLRRLADWLGGQQQ